MSWWNKILGKIRNKFSKPVVPPLVTDDFEIAYNESRKEQQQEVDRILDKIAGKGMDSLTKRERDFLQQQKR
ncbi:MAG: hypothetical protein LBH34_06115 [Prevotellaceae bacterium]|jgi:hypothetical protein|nr:hypothetical protein [Prevotellaceae bacterium]